MNEIKLIDLVRVIDESVTPDICIRFGGFETLLEGSKEDILKGISDKENLNVCGVWFSTLYSQMIIEVE